jgi:hypothetical protein
VRRSSNPAASGIKQLRIDEQHIRAFARCFQQVAVEAVAAVAREFRIGRDEPVLDEKVPGPGASAKVPHAHDLAPLGLAERQNTAELARRGGDEHGDVDLDLRAVSRIGDNARVNFCSSAQSSARSLGWILPIRYPSCCWPV